MKQIYKDGMYKTEKKRKQKTFIIIHRIERLLIENDKKGSMVRIHCG